MHRHNLQAMLPVLKAGLTHELRHHTRMSVQVVVYAGYGRARRDRLSIYLFVSFDNKALAVS